MKKVLVLLVMVFVGLSAQAFAATVSIPDTDANPGAAIEIPVTIDDATGLLGFQFSVSYDAEALQAVGTKAGELTSGWMIVPNLSERGMIKVAGIDTSLTGLGKGVGNIVKLQFKVVGKPGKKNTLSFAVCSLSDSEGKKIASTCKEGQIKIKGPKKEK